MEQSHRQATGAPSDPAGDRAGHASREGQVDSKGHDAALAQAGPALFRMIRYWARRWPQRAAGAETETKHVSRVVVVDIVGTTPGRPNVRSIADALGVDPSVASRMVADTVAAGLIERRTMERDARNADLALTESGHDLLAHARTWQGDVFAALTADWPAEDRETFAALLVRFADRATSAGL
ncbi:MarR family winged helix-turn-helix transcriptional regulator [Sinosporangium siamense]|uniref:MarR family transcriptional regulator n=1 Tax=Sinosporangium siamense TaxID=1367973 RepID=A0A919RFY1_9ACTN|nr:MarR family winged helix-turn-helix transcriptional regulator [Sinosporangium siamense]GII92903.1 MarR family transcriptional regulator [Sinosporangium siamense]